MLELAPNDPLIKAYLKDLRHLKGEQSVDHELGPKGPFQKLLAKAARRRSWTLIAELSTYSGGRRVVGIEGHQRQAGGGDSLVETTQLPVA
ncbi:MAG: hypothetical protein ABIR70_14975 [Bryobacteraceae bacterium]